VNPVNKTNAFVTPYHTDSDMLIKFCTYCPAYVFAKEYYKFFPPHLNNASTLPCESQNFCFCANSNAGKSKLAKFCLLTLIYLLKMKRCNLSTLTLCYGKFNQEIMYQTLTESASFCRWYDKNILMHFSIHSSNCCSLAKREC